MRFVGEQYDNPNKDKHILIDILCTDWVRILLLGKALEGIPLGYAFRLVFSPYALRKLFDKAIRDGILDVSKYQTTQKIPLNEVMLRAKDKKRPIKA